MILKDHVSKIATMNSHAKCGKRFAWLFIDVMREHTFITNHKKICRAISQHVDREWERTNIHGLNLSICEVED